MLGRKAVMLMLLLIGTVPGAYAQTQYEVTPFVGYRFGGQVDLNTPDVDRVNIKSSANYGFLAGVSIWQILGAEFMWNRQPTTMTAHSAVTGDVTEVAPDARLDMYQFSLLYNLRDLEQQFQPFIVAGLGWTHFESQGVLNFKNRFSYNFGGGAKYFFTDHLGVRGELRYSPTRTTTSDTVFCDPFFGCFITPVTNHAQQGQANAGVIFRF